MAAADALSGRNFWYSEDCRGCAGNDTIHGLGNEDSVNGCEVASAGVSVNLATGDPLFVGTDTLRGIETVRSTFTPASGGPVTDGLTDGLTDGSCGSYGSVAFTGTYSLRGSVGNGLLTGTTGYQLLLGGNGNDTLKAGDCADLRCGYNGGDGEALNKTTLYTDNDSLDGGNGNDILPGGTGKDTLTGGSGADRFRFASAPGSSNFDSVKDCGVADDTIEWKSAIFAKLTMAGATLSSSFFRANPTGTATDSNDYIVYDTDSGQLFYEADGSAAGAKVLVAALVASLDGFPVLTSADIFVT